MASSTATLLLPRTTAVAASPQPRPKAVYRRRLLLLPIISSPALLFSRPTAAKARDIPLFGIRKKLEKLEEDAVEVVKEGEKVLEDGIEATEKEVAAAEEEIVESAASFRVAGDLLQAVAVAGVEAVGVFVGVSVVNQILGPESQKS